MAPSATSTESASTLSPRRRWAALAVLSASLLVIAMDMTILNIALPEMAAELQPTSDQQLWIVSIYSLVLAGLLVSVAAMADRWGRRRMLVLGYGVFAASSFLVLIANSAEAVIAIRALLGVGGAMIMPTTLSMIRVVFTDAKERATALSIWAAGSGLGVVIGPLVGGFLLEHFSWHAAFLVNIPLMVVGIVAGLALLPESRVAVPGRWDGVAAVLSFVGMVSLIWAFKQFGKEASFVVPGALVAVVIAGVTLGWFGVRCLRSDHPLLDLRLFHNRQFSAGILAALATTFATIAVLLLVAQWLQLVEGETPIQAGLRLMPIAVAGSIASLAAPPLSRLIGSRAVLAGGLAFTAVGLVYIGVSGSNLHVVNMIIALSLVGVGMGALAIGSAMIMAAVPTSKAGNAGALEETAYEFGGTLGVAILGSVAAVAFRAALTTTSGFESLQQLDPTLAGQAKESLGAVMMIAQELDMPELAASAAGAFTDSLQTTGLIGGVIMFAVTVGAFFLIPKGTDVAASAPEPQPEVTGSIGHLE